MEGADAADVALAQTGDQDAFQRLVERHAGAVFRLAVRISGSREDADDVVQETFLRAWRALPRFDGRAQLGTWLHRIATNAALDLGRRKAVRREGSHEPEVLERVPSRDAGPEGAALSAETRARVAAAMGRLSGKERAAFVLRHLEGRSIAEIAAALGIREGAAKGSVFRAVAKLREELFTR